ncbi:hypothetical protein Nepgr_014948 [Nepenthes gracilis]|uniref:Uncharacterized protein n=1 Tax=Nepenthes gracilis TaxID=150966 RepID=A0AAD3XPZ4_NEPGR|nr:hypothetical protein Nepgr_014948 [Nepenthes gracilis]
MLPLSMLPVLAGTEAKGKHLNKRNERRAYSYSMLADPASQIRICASIPLSPCQLLLSSNHLRPDSIAAPSLLFSSDLSSRGRDMRFVLVLCAMIGFSLWWGAAPEPLLLKPEALSAPDINLVTQVVKETFVNRVCTNHPQVLSPCDCGEPLNNIARSLFEEPPFDPLGIKTEETGRASEEGNGMTFLRVLRLLTLGRGEALISVYSASRRSNIDWGTLPATPSKRKDNPLA